MEVQTYLTGQWQLTSRTKFLKISQSVTPQDYESQWSHFWKSENQQQTYTGNYASTTNGQRITKQFCVVLGPQIPKLYASHKFHKTKFMLCSQRAMPNIQGSPMLIIVRNSVFCFRYLVMVSSLNKDDNLCIQICSSF